MFFTLFFGMIMFLSLSHESYYAYAEKPVEPVNAKSVEAKSDKVHPTKEEIKQKSNKQSTEDLVDIISTKQVNATSVEPVNATLVESVNATTIEPVDSNATSVESVNATSTELIYEPTNVAKKSCNALEKENKTKSEGNEKAKTNNDCDSEADAFAEYFNEELDSIFYELDLILDEFNVDKEKSHTKEPPGKPRIIKHGSITAVARPLYTTVDDPANHIVSPGGPLDGVGQLILNRSDGTFICSGSLLLTGEHVLTAAHCVTDENGIINLFSGSVTFFGNSGTEVISLDAAQTVVPINWDGDYLRGNDIAVIKLVKEASPDITRYDIDKNKNDDVGTIGEKAGFGASGTGDTGWTFSDGQERAGKNKYDDFADVWLKLVGFKQGKDFDKGSVLLYDFDNGLAENDAFGFFFRNSDLGLGIEEVSAAFGDSGGPTIVDGKITGVTSYILSLTVGSKTSDVTDKLDSSFGEFSGDTRVSKYTKFVENAMNDRSLSKKINSTFNEFDFLDDIEQEYQQETEGGLSDEIETIIEELDGLLEELAEESSPEPEDLFSDAIISIEFETNESELISVGDTIATGDEETNNILELDGEGDYLKITNDTSTNYLTGLTLLVWIQPDYSQGSSEFTVLSKENSFDLSINNRIEPQKVAKFSVFDGIKWTTVDSNSIINEEWTHLAATFNGESISIYVNGELEGTENVIGIPTISVNGKLKTRTVDSIESDSDIIIGAYISTNRGEYKVFNQFSGQIDNVLLFDTNLSKKQINEIYEQGLTVLESDKVVIP